MSIQSPPGAPREVLVSGGLDSRGAIQVDLVLLPDEVDDRSPTPRSRSSYTPCVALMWAISATARSGGFFIVSNESARSLGFAHPSLLAPSQQASVLKLCSRQLVVTSKQRS